MRRHDDVSEVELVEDDDQPDGLDLVADAGPGPGTRPGNVRARRWLRRAWPVPLGIVAALVVAVWVGDVAERTRMQQLREDARHLPGVVTALTEDVAFTEISDSAVTAMYFGARVDGVTVGAGTSVLADSEAVVGVDTGTGEALWDWTPPPGSISSDGYASTACWPTGSTVTCASGWWSSYSTTTDDDVTQFVVAEPATRVVELDPATGAVRSEAQHDGMLTGDGDDELSALASATAGSLQVTAARPGTDEELWTTTLPLDPAEDLTSLMVDVAAGAVHVYVDTGSWALDRADGSVRYQGDGYQVPARADRMVELSTARPAVMSSDGTVLGSLDGYPVDLGVDDGSSPELELFVRQNGVEPSALVALDIRDGSEAWSSPMPDLLGGEEIVLGGTLYAGTSTGPAAWDLGTGEQRWAAASGDSEGWGLVTDGAVLATIEQQEDGIHLVARSLDSGERLWDVLTPVDAGAYLFSAQGSAVLSGGDENIYLIGPGSS